MDSVFDQGAFAPCPAPFNMAACVLRGAGASPDKSALEILHATHAERLTYGALEAAVLGVARGLLGLGLQAGDRVLMRLGNGVNFPITYLACLAVDLVPVPTSAALTAPEVSGLLDVLSPSLIIAGAGIACPQMPGCPVLPEAELTRMRTLPPASYAMGDPERPGYIIFTSGSSAKARGVCHAHRAIWARRMMWKGWYGLRETDRLLHAGAMNWTYTLGTGLMDPWTIGATALIPAPGTAPGALPALLAQSKATLFAAAPGVFRQLLKDPQPIDLPHLRHGLSAGEKLADAVAQQWQAATGTKIYEALGMTECSTYVSGRPGHDLPDGAIGVPQTGRRIAVLDAVGEPAPRDTPGTLAVHMRDPGLMLGYLTGDATAGGTGDDDATGPLNLPLAKGWFLTGDLAQMGAGGDITLLGRDDDMMNAGGFRVSPLEVERALNAHPDVRESAVAQVTVKADTRVIAAFYVADDSPLTAEGLAAHTSARLARYKCPRVFVRLDALPRAANGKLNRRGLARHYEEHHGKA